MFKIRIYYNKLLYSGIERQITSMKIKRETQESPIIISRKIDISAQQSKTTINNSIVNVRHINISLWNINSFLIIKKKKLYKNCRQKLHVYYLRRKLFICNLSNHNFKPTKKRNVGIFIRKCVIKAFAFLLIRF